mmetsp:Transcript_11742/g.40288  ORF Transcript_11742/g.40288 Transcript_11742/m.40288 type:complete len:189 (+) Transcript_11742:23-589(+)
MGLASSDLCAPAGENTVDEAEQEEVPSEKDEQLRESDTGHNPPQPIEKSEVEKLSEFKAKFMRGLMLIKFGRNSIAKRRVFVLNIETRTFTWKVPTEAPKRSRFAPAKIPVYSICEILKVRTALEPDPKVPAFGGTEVLRRGLNPKEASKAFILDMADNRTIDLVAASEIEAAEYVDGFKRLIAEDSN